MINQEINEAVTKKLCTPHPTEPNVYFMKGDAWREKYRDISMCPDYSTDIKAAWEILEGRKGIQVWSDSDSGKWRCTMWLEKDCNGNTVLSEADTAPRAICLAFLKLDPNPSL